MAKGLDTILARKRNTRQPNGFEYSKTMQSPTERPKGPDSIITGAARSASPSHVLGPDAADTKESGFESRVDVASDGLRVTGLPTVSVVIPVYNSQATLRELIDRLVSVLPGVVNRYEMVLVNDGSRDGSWATIKELAMAHPEIRGISFTRNYGQQSALLAGIRSARYEIVITMDDDLQHPPEEIPQLLAELSQGHDVVYGTYMDGQHGFWRDLAANLTRVALSTAMGVQNAHNVTAFRAFRTQLRDGFAGYQSPFVAIDVLLTWATTRFSSTLIRHDRRKIGRSNYTFGQLVKVALNLMTSFSTLPLQLASLIGFALTLFGVLVFIWVVARYLVLGYSMPGFPFLASIIAIFSGAQMFALGIIGEYLARMHFRMMARPPYTVREVIEDRTS